MRTERVAPQSEVIRVIILEDSQCCGGPHRCAIMSATNLQSSSSSVFTFMKFAACDGKTRGDPGHSNIGQSIFAVVPRSNEPVDTRHRPAPFRRSYAGAGVRPGWGVCLLPGSPSEFRSGLGLQGGEARTVMVWKRSGSWSCGSIAFL